MITDVAGVSVLVLGADGEPLADEQAVTDLVGEAAWSGATWLALPIERLPADFFDLRTGVAGMVVQKATNYRLSVAILGDADAHLAESGALRAFFTEGARSANLVLLPGLDALRERLAAA